MSDWYQQHLTPPDVIEVNVRIGAVPSADHVQALVELTDPVTGVLIGQWSRPHAPLRDMLEVVEWACAKAKQALSDSAEPF